MNKPGKGWLHRLLLKKKIRTHHLNWTNYELSLETCSIIKASLIKICPQEKKDFFNGKIHNKT
jgi:hypothetical protein